MRPRDAAAREGGGTCRSTPAEDVPPGGAVDRPNFSLENDANAKARRDVLARIDRMPHLTDAQKAKLTSSVDRARGMGCIFIIPFGVGKKTLDAKETDILVSGFKSASDPEAARRPDAGVRGARLRGQAGRPGGQRKGVD